MLMQPFGVTEFPSIKQQYILCHGKGIDQQWPLGHHTDTVPPERIATTAYHRMITINTDRAAGLPFHSAQNSRECRFTRIDLTEQAVDFSLLQS